MIRKLLKEYPEWIPMFFFILILTILVIASGEFFAVYSIKTIFVK